MAFEAFSVPTLILFEVGIPKDRIEGLVPASRIEQMLAE
jgi:thioredoxin-like negative regulator of GroEL